MAIKVEPVGKEHFEQILPLLKILNSRRSDDYWLPVFSYEPIEGRPLGFRLVDEVRTVGFLGTVFKQDECDPDKVICNINCWIVDENYKNHSLKLLKPLIAEKNLGITNFTPDPSTFSILEMLGFQIEGIQGRFIIPTGFLPFSGKVSFFSNENDGVQLLSETDRKIYYDHQKFNACHLLAKIDKEVLYIVYTVKRYEKYSLCKFHYINDLDLFSDVSEKVYWHLLLKQKTFGVSMPESYWKQIKEPKLSMKQKIRSRVAYILPWSDIRYNSLYSELFLLDLRIS